MESSECESANDTDAEQPATVHCTSTEQVGEGARLLRQKQTIWLRIACIRNTAEQWKLLKSVLRGCRAFALTRHDDCWMKIIQAGTQQKTLQVFGPQLAEICRTPHGQVDIYTVLTAPPCNIMFNERQVITTVYWIA